MYLYNYILMVSWDKGNRRKEYLKILEIKFTKLIACAF